MKWVESTENSSHSVLVARREEEEKEKDELLVSEVIYEVLPVRFAVGNAHEVEVFSSPYSALAHQVHCSVQSSSRNSSDEEARLVRDQPNRWTRGSTRRVAEGSDRHDRHEPFLWVSIDQATDDEAIYPIAKRAFVLVGWVKANRLNLWRYHHRRRRHLRLRAQIWANQFRLQLSTTWTTTTSVDDPK